MPRTRPPRKLKSSVDLSDEIEKVMKDFEKHANIKLNKIKSECDIRIREMDTMVNVCLSRLPSDIRKLTLGEILTLDLKDNKENDLSTDTVEKSFHTPPPSALKTKKKEKRTTVTSDDGYVTEGGTRQSRATVPASSKSRLRSSSRSRKTKLINTAQKTVLKSSKDCSKTAKSNANNFKTPATLKPSNNNEFGPVTPKVKPNTPMSILRRPREGEMVLSMQGSPLLVSAVIQERSANVNVPLHNGDVISLLPRDGLRLSNIPNLDAETVRQLEMLKGHIEKVISFK